MTEEAKFCYRCGTGLEIRDAGGFNTQTGKRNRETFCPNVGNCATACSQRPGGHRYSFLGVKCKDCAFQASAW